MFWLLLAVAGAAAGAPCAVLNGLGESVDGRCVVAACYAGFTPAGDFCAPCAVGTFKAADGAAACAPCGNAPSRATYTRMGAASATCPYECAPGFYGAWCLSLYLLLVLSGTAVGGVLLVLYVQMQLQRRAREREVIKRR